MRVQVFVSMLIIILLLGSTAATDSCDAMNEKIDLLLKQNATQNKSINSATADMNEASEKMNNSSGIIKDINNNQIQFSEFVQEMNTNLPTRTFYLFFAYSNVVVSLLIVLIIAGVVYPFVKKPFIATQNKRMKHKINELNQIVSTQKHEIVTLNEKLELAAVD